MSDEKIWIASASGVAAPDTGRTPATRKVRAGRRTVEITRPDEVVFPEAGVSKGDLVEYYRRIAREMLPHIRQRPLIIESFPNGVERKGVCRTGEPDWLPDWIDRQEVGGSRDPDPHLVCSKAAALVYLAEQGMITPHVWLSRIARPDHPDRMMFDLDPPDDGDFDCVRDAAERLRTVLERVHLASFPMTTGSRGIHVLVPLTGRERSEEVHRFARRVAEMTAEEAPGRIAVEPRAEERSDRTLIGTERNRYGRTAVAPYAVRARPEAPVAAPFTWSDLSKVGPRHFTVANIFRRLARREDPWRDMRRMTRSLGRARRPL